MQNFTINKLATPGNQDLYGGLSFRWGISNIQATSDLRVTYDKAFNNNTLLVLLTVRDSVQLVANPFGNYHNENKLGFNLINNYYQSALTYSWLAIGY